MMRPEETYNEWHRRAYPDQYVWENYSYPKLGISDGQLVCKLPIRIFNCDNCQLVVDNTEISESHKSTIDYIIRNQEIFVEDIRESVFEYYTFLWNDYLKDFEDEIKYPNPAINAAEMIDSMITPYSIHLAGKISEGYFGICFICTFEDEHGLGIELRNYKVNKAGGSDIGFSLYSDD